MIARRKDLACSLLAISGSLRAASSNTLLLGAMATMAAPDMAVTLYDELASLPHFNPDLDGDGEAAPMAVRRFRALLQEADGLLICTPEYAYGVPGSLKNALDWVVSSGELAGKPVAVVSASPSYMGGEKAHAALLLTLRAEAAQIVDGGTLIVSAVKEKIDDRGVLTDAATEAALKGLLAATLRAIQRQKTAALRAEE